ncbi:MAG: hypothetical protein BGO55_13290 [Sphingobacteriales bacterium 50-39]|nr:hypothetical protein [Sphingobacteriales bacterium]OJW57273.1 MAG: hypothetical protein BGO55_13290 [Sphingobacteriales bacterium 50-39]
MDDQEKKTYKAALKQFALDLISTRIEAARLLADQAQEAANQEEKSSAGDKYETSRAMGQNLKEMHSRQQAEHARELATLHQVRVDTLYSTAIAGAFIQCPHIGFFIAAGLGKQQLHDHTILFLSPEAPLAKALYQRRAGDSFVFNGQSLLIQDIF